MVMIVTNIFFVRQNLMRGGAGPRSLKIRKNPPLIQRVRNFRLAFALRYKCVVHPTHGFDLIIWAWQEDHTIGLDAFVLSHFEQSLVFTRLVNEHPPQPKACRAALFEAKLNEAADRITNASCSLYSTGLA